MLENISLFAGLNEDDLATLRQHIVRKNYPRNTVVLTQGDKTSSLYLIDTGSVKVYVSDKDGNEFILGILEAKDYFGELALLDEDPRAASVMTIEPCCFGIITQQDFLAWTRRRPEILMNLIKALVKRIRMLDEDITSLALLDVYGRTVRLLLQRSVEIDQKRVVDHITQQEIANMVGASREMVSRILKGLRQGGYIELDGKRIIIKTSLPRGW